MPGETVNFALFHVRLLTIRVVGLPIALEFVQNPVPDGVRIDKLRG